MMPNDAQRPYFLFSRGHNDTRWTAAHFQTEAAARARIKTIAAKPSWWVLFLNEKGSSTVIDESRPTK